MKTPAPYDRHPRKPYVSPDHRDSISRHTVYDIDSEIRLTMYDDGFVFASREIKAVSRKLRARWSVSEKLMVIGDPSGLFAMDLTGPSPCDT